MTESVYDVLVLGAGPGGYVAAVQAAEAGLRTAIVEHGAIGGTCLNVGCIPSKALIHVADQFNEMTDTEHLRRVGLGATAPSIDLAATMAWKRSVVERLGSGVGSLLSHANVQHIQGWATILDGKTIQVETANDRAVVRTRNLIIATGSEPIELPVLPFGGPVISSTGVLALERVPESLVVVGAGYIGLELGTAFRKLGANVAIVEAADRVLPQYDKILTEPVSRRARSLGIALHLGQSVIGLDPAGKLLISGVDGRHALEAEQILVAAGRRPATAGWGLEALGLRMNGAAIAIDDRCQTSMRGVYAIGDVTGEPMLAHRASAQAIVAANIIAGRQDSWSGRFVPTVCFTDPEIVTIGMSPHDAAAQAVPVRVGIANLSANGRALSLDRTDGAVRVVARAADDLVVGIQATGHGIAELASEFVLALEMGATLTDLAGTAHSHPTLGEAVQEAASRALHKSQPSRARSHAKALP